MVVGVIVNAINAHKKKVSRQNSSNSIHYSNPNVYSSPQNGRQSTLFRYNSYADKKDFAELRGTVGGVQIANIIAEEDESPYGMTYGEALRYQREVAQQNNYNQNNYNYNQNNNNYNQNNVGGEAIRQEALRQNNVQTNASSNAGFLAVIRRVRQENQQY